MERAGLGDLRFHDGRSLRFPESYHAKTLTQGAAFEIGDAAGNHIQLKRDDSRNLVEIISPSGHSLKFSYGVGVHPIRAEEAAGTIRRYSYDHDHLTQVSDDSRLLYEFKYSPILGRAGYDKYMMTSIRDGTGKEILHNSYVNGRVSEERLANGEIYRFKYRLEGDEVVETTIEFPDRGVRIFNFYHGMPVPD